MAEKPPCFYPDADRARQGRAPERFAALDALTLGIFRHQLGRDPEQQNAADQLEEGIVHRFGNDEGEEATTFNGTIPQALMMMNGELIEKATSAESGSFLNTVLTKDKSATGAVRHLYLATLGRGPNRKELPAAQKLIAGSASPLAGYQDLFWALLNSNEFIFIR